VDKSTYNKKLKKGRGYKKNLLFDELLIKSIMFHQFLSDKINNNNNNNNCWKKILSAKK